jgi:acetyltransferase-like isoleucine patch superfamily enzyme
MLKVQLKRIQNSYYKFRFRNCSVRFLPNSKIDSKCFFEGYNSVGENTRLLDCSFGFGSYIGRNVQLSAVKIGRYCSIGSFITNSIGRHPSSKFVSTHPAFFSIGKAAGFTFSNCQKFEELKYASKPERVIVKIGNDVWIGDNVLIMDGVTIGDGAIIGAGSVVTKNIEPYSINVGIPAKPIKHRFSQKQIDFLLQFKWWNKDLKWIRENSDIFSDIDNFRKMQNEKN